MAETTPSRHIHTTGRRVSTSQETEPTSPERAENVSDDVVSQVASKVEDMSLADGPPVEGELVDTDSGSGGPHPWENVTPAERGLEDTVRGSEKYKPFVKQSYIYGEMVLIRKIVNDLPDSITERFDQKGTRRDERLEAQPIRTTPDYAKSTYYIDCEYFCTIHIPSISNEYFRINRKKVSGVEESCRWIFVPSYCRARCGFFDWSNTEVENTFRVIVVRPSQFNEYREEVERRSNLCVAVLSLPGEGNGVGYARYWIQKIAEHFELNWVWMIDDDVKWMHQFYPSESTTATSETSDSESMTPKCSFEFVFETIEELAKVNDLAVVGPRVYNGQSKHKIRDAFMHKPPRGVVLLNVQKIREKKVHYRPELVILEDMIFGHECSNAGLKVCVTNRFHFCNIPKWKKSGTSATLGSPTQLPQTPGSPMS